ncbi:hypothetical protein ACJJTC_002041 [Scirpophaga incertulas]
MPPKEPMKTPISTRRRTATRRCHEERSVVPMPIFSASRNLGNQENQEDRNTRLPPTGKNVGDLPTYPATSSSPTPYADTKKTLADRPTNATLRQLQLQILPARANPARYPMPTISMIPGEGEGELVRSLEAKLGRKFPVYFTREGNHIHYNPTSVEEYFVIWDHLNEHNANILRRENHQQALLSRPLESRSPPTTQPTVSAVAAREATPQQTPTPSMSVSSSRSASPARTPTPLLSANASRDGSPARTPTPTPQYEEYEEQDALQPRTPTPDVAETILEPSPTPISPPPRPRVQKRRGEEPRKSKRKPKRKKTTRPASSEPRQIDAVYSTPPPHGDTEGKSSTNKLPAQDQCDTPESETKKATASQRSASAYMLFELSTHESGNNYSAQNTLDRKYFPPPRNRGLGAKAPERRKTRPWMAPHDRMPKEARNNPPDRSRERSREAEHDRLRLAARGIEGGGESPARLPPPQANVIILSNIQLKPPTTGMTTDSPASLDEEMKTAPTRPTGDAREAAPRGRDRARAPRGSADADRASLDRAERPLSRGSDSAPRGSADADRGSRDRANLRLSRDGDSAPRGCADVDRGSRDRAVRPPSRDGDGVSADDADAARAPSSTTTAPETTVRGKVDLARATTSEVEKNALKVQKAPSSDPRKTAPIDTLVQRKITPPSPSTRAKHIIDTRRPTFRKTDNPGLIKRSPEAKQQRSPPPSLPGAPHNTPVTPARPSSSRTVNTIMALSTLQPKDQRRPSRIEPRKIDIDVSSDAMSRDSSVASNDSGPKDKKNRVQKLKSPATHPPPFGGTTGAMRGKKRAQEDEPEFRKPTTIPKMSSATTPPKPSTSYAQATLAGGKSESEDETTHLARNKNEAMDTAELALPAPTPGISTNNEGTSSLTDNVTVRSKKAVYSSPVIQKSKCITKSFSKESIHNLSLSPTNTDIVSRSYDLSTNMSLDILEELRAEIIELKSQLQITNNEMENIILENNSLRRRIIQVEKQNKILKEICTNPVPISSAKDFIQKTKKIDRRHSLYVTDNSQCLNSNTAINDNMNIDGKCDYDEYENNRNGKKNK